MQGIAIEVYDVQRAKKRADDLNQQHNKNINGGSGSTRDLARNRHTTNCLPISIAVTLSVLTNSTTEARIR